MTFLKLLRITGSSLEPEYNAGDFVLISKIPFLFRPPKPGDVVVFRQPSYGILIKKVDRLAGPAGEQIFVRGAHPQSVDSARFGPLSPGDITGLVIVHIHKKQ